MTGVLVHAAWSDASVWNRVILGLRRSGVAAVAVQLSLTSLSDDAAAVLRALRRVEGPVVLVGHSYGGAVITAAGADNEQVTGLVYIAAMAPDRGETVAELLHRVPAHLQAPALTPDAQGLLWMSQEGFANAVAADSAEEETFLMAATQKPTSLRCITEAMTTPAWQQKRSWFLLAERDRIIAPETQSFMAARAGATVDSRDVDHTPLTSAPEAVVRLVGEAVQGA